jgi:hypothetical protein
VGGPRAENARWWGALLAGAIFAFAPFHFAHLLGHMQVFAYQFVPFAVLTLLRAMQVAADQSDRPQRWLASAALAGLFFALMALCDWYFALYVLLFGVGALLWRSLRLLQGRRREAAGMVWASSVVAGSVALLLLAPVLLPMLREASQSDHMIRPAGDLYTYSASAVDFVIPSRMHSLLRAASGGWPGNQVAPISERTLAVGYVALLLALAGLLLDRRRAGGWLVAALLFVLLALGPRPTLGNITAETIPPGAPLDEWSPYNVVNTLVPFMRISRSVSRFALMVQLALSVAAAAGAAALLLRLRGKRWAAVVAGLALALLLAEFWVAPFPMSPPDTPDWYRSAAAQPADPRAPNLLNLPMNYERPGYLLYQTEHGRPLTGGYISRDDPRTMTERVPLLQQLRHLGPDIIETDLAAEGPTMLRDLRVGAIVLDRYKMPGGAEREVTEALVAQVMGPQPPTYVDERLTVYAPPALSRAATYLRLGPAGWGPLVQDDEGQPLWRVVSEEPAAVEVAHARGGEVVSLRYASGVAVRVLDGNGAAVGLLPPAQVSSSVEIPVPPGGQFALATDGGDALVQSLALVDAAAP